MKRIFCAAFFLCAKLWCEFPCHIERQWHDLETVLCKKNAVAIYIFDRSNDPIFLSALHKAVFEILSGEPSPTLELKVQERSDLILTIIISRERKGTCVAMCMAGEDYEAEGKPYFLDCFQTTEDNLFEETVLRLRQKFLEIKESGGSLMPYIAIDGSNNR
jgi:hypothetical protein